MKIDIKEIRREICSFFSLTDKEFQFYIDNEKELDILFYEDETNLSYYETIDYVAIAYECFNKYSRNDCNVFYTYCGNNTDIKFNSIIDTAAGIGITTLLLSKMFPDKTIYYSNIPSKQYEFADHILPSSVIRTTKYEVSDVTFCIESFEHFKDPTATLEEMIKETSCKYFLVSNAFRSRGYGHFTNFQYKNTLVSNTQIGRLFNNTFRNNGFRIRKSFWNSRPCLWERI